MNKIIDKLKSVEGYKKNTAKIIGYAEDITKTDSDITKSYGYGYKNITWKHLEEYKMYEFKYQ